MISAIHLFAEMECAVLLGRDIKDLEEKERQTSIMQIKHFLRKLEERVW